MPLISCKIDLILTSSSNFVSTNSTNSCAITDSKVYVPVVTLLSQDNVNWNKYQSKVSIERQNQHLNYLIDPSFQEVKKLFVLSFEDNSRRIRYAGYFLFSKILFSKTILINQQKMI